MPKVKALHSIGVAHLLGTYPIQNASGVIPNGAKLVLEQEIIDLIGADSFEVVTEEENKTMSEETTPAEGTPATPETVTPENAPVTPETQVTPEIPAEGTPAV